MTRVWAVARVCMLEVARSTSTWVFVPFLIAVAWFAPLVSREGDLLDRLRLIASYGLGLPWFLVSLAVVAWGTSSIGGELERHSIFHLGTKPVRSAEVLAGKWLGAVLAGLLLWLLLFLLFAVHASVTFASTSSDAERHLARERFLRTRLERLPEPRPVSPETIRALVAKEWAEEGRGDTPIPAEARRDLELRVTQRLEIERARSGESIRIVFRGLGAVPDGATLFLRYRVHLLPWQFVEAKAEWRAGGEPFSRGWVAQASWETIAIPAGGVNPDGNLEIELANLEPSGSPVEIVLPRGAAVILEPVRNLGTEMFASLALAVAQLGFIAAVAVAGGAAFSLPTANLLAFTVLLGAFSIGAAGDAVAAIASTGGEPNSAMRILFVIARAVTVVFPDLAAEHPAGRIADGLAIPRETIISSLVWTLGVRGTLLLAAGALLWWRREPGGAAE